MSKIEWGVKRRCNDCAAPFYDLRRDPIHCPKCGSLFRPQAAMPRTAAGARRFRGRAVPAEALLAAAPAEAVDADEAEADGADEAETEDDEAEADDTPREDDEAPGDEDDDNGNAKGFA